MTHHWLCLWLSVCVLVITCFPFLLWPTRRLLKLGSASSEVSWDILFMFVSRWCKSEKLWDVLLKHAYVCRERLSLHSGGVLQGSMCSQLSALHSLSGREGGDVGNEWLFLSLSLSLAWLWRQGRPVKGGRRKVGQAREGRGLAAFMPHPVSLWCQCV